MNHSEFLDSGVMSTGIALVCICLFNLSCRCADGYYGNPTVPGDSCLPCNCNGNIDPLEAGSCDSVTGECLKCIGNTDGRHCERCAHGFYGDAVTAKNCSGECVGCAVKSIAYHSGKSLSIYLGQKVLRPRSPLTLSDAKSSLSALISLVSYSKCRSSGQGSTKHPSL